MGLCARAAQSSGGETFGVIPAHLVKAEAAKSDAHAKFIVTETMHERKKVMFMNCDAIVVLPGGAGSLDEFFEVLTWRQLGLHQKPIFLLNTDGYWTPLIQLVEHVIKEGFADPGLRDYLRVTGSVSELTGILRAALS
jgi:uncharacterized protein (TIGR00730 family)